MEIVNSKSLELAVNPPYPGTVLQMGSTGNNVRIMQTYLNAIRTAFFPGLPLLATDGNFGSMTRQAVLYYQSVAGLVVDGKIGPLAWDSIVNKYRSISPGVDPPYPGTVLQVGSTGSNVRLMQKYLNVIRIAFFPTLPLLIEDGIFGQNTKLAVMGYQALTGLTQDGKIGPLAWNSIVLKYRSAPKPPVADPGPGTGLQVGSTGSDVKMMQTYLNAIRSAFYPTLPLLAEDGVFEQNMKQAVMEYQALENLVQDGIIGPLTWNSIVLKYQDIPVDPVNPPYPGTVLQIGSTGSNVRLMQTYLNAIRVAIYPSLPMLEVDGVYGSKTYQCVYAYQGLEGLTQDGKIGEHTWNSIVRKYQSIPSGPVWPGTDLTYGSTGAEVLYMQRRLNVVQPVYTAINALTTDEDFGTETGNAVRRFQEQFGLSADAIIGEDTWDTIESVASAVESGTNPPVYTQYPGYVLESGSSGDPVRFVQSYLNTVNTVNGYGWTDLTVDGMYGTQTGLHVEAFQFLKGLTVDGKVGNNTWTTLRIAFNQALN